MTFRPEVDDPEVLPPGERTEEDVLAAVRVLFPDARVVDDVERVATLLDDGILLIEPGLIYSGKNGENLLGKMNIDDDGDDDSVVSARVEIFERDEWWMTITGELFGPFPTEDAAIDTIPQALRSTF